VRDNAIAPDLREATAVAQNDWENRVSRNPPSKIATPRWLARENSTAGCREKTEQCCSEQCCKQQNRLAKPD
jgi:hypothetical protein